MNNTILCSCFSVVIISCLTLKLSSWDESTNSWISFTPLSAQSLTTISLVMNFLNLWQEPFLHQFSTFSSNQLMSVILDNFMRNQESGPTKSDNSLISDIGILISGYPTVQESGTGWLSSSTANAVNKSLWRHTWLFSQHLCLAAIVNDDLDDIVRANMAAKLLGHPVPDSYTVGYPKINLPISEIKELSDLVGPDSWFLIKLSKISFFLLLRTILLYGGDLRRLLW